MDVRGYRQDRRMFGDRKTGAYLHRFGWTGIVRHQIVRYRASPDDPDLTEYWDWRRRKAPPADPQHHTHTRTNATRTRSSRMR